MRVTLLTDRDRTPFLVDEADLEVVSRYTWRINPDGYPETTIGKWPNNKSLTLHLFLLGHAPAGLEWDHENRNRIDNSRSNLRAITHKANTRNFGLRRTNKSGVAGVRWHRRLGRWRAEITVNGKTKHLGLFDSIDAAARARRAAEGLYWGATA